jgi:hypothetical protein
LERIWAHTRRIGSNYYSLLFISANPVRSVFSLFVSCFTNLRSV